METRRRMFWFFYILFEIFIWNYPVRAAIVGQHPIVHMGASALNDILWLPLAIALLVYIFLLFRRLVRQIIVREVAAFLFIILCVNFIINVKLLFRFQFIFLLAFFVLWSVQIYQSRAISVHMVLFAIALSGLIIHYQMQLLPSLPKSSPSLSIMSFNMNTKTALDDERTIQFIRTRFPDIVCLQELSMHDQKFILNKLGDLYPFYLSPAARFGKNDVMILSRKEILYGDHIPLKTFAKSYHSVNHAVIRYDGRQINLINCHLHHAYRNLGAYLSYPDSVDCYRALSDAYRQHQEEAQLLAAYARSLEGPTIITGDFNDTPNSFTYGLFDAFLRNAFATAGWGLGASFGKWSAQVVLPGILQGFAFDDFRIDHVFLSDDFKILTAQLENIGAFDHLPQIVTVALK
jgi:endonuclease/exonuclease/phosphatase (EEP) superfamily protein YafD